MPVLFWIDVTIYCLSTIISFSLCLIVFGAEPGNRINQFFGLYCFFSALWTLFAALLRFSLWLNKGDPDFLAGCATLSFLLSGPFLLLFTSRYVKKRLMVTDFISAGGILFYLVLTYPVFAKLLQHNHYLGANGTTHVTYTTLGLVAASIPIVFIACSVVLFWIYRRNIAERYLFLSVVILLTGMVVGGILDINVPILSFATLVSVVILGTGVVGKQLFNPLKEKNRELKEEIGERQKTEKALRKSEAQVRALLAGIPDAIFTLDEKGTFLDYIAPDDFKPYESPDIFIGKKQSEVLPENISKEFEVHIANALESGKVQLYEYAMDAGGRTGHFEARISKIAENRVLGILRDVTKRKSLEEDLLQARKMEAIGRLAGGIAHDFNNILTVILNYSDLTLLEQGLPGSLKTDLEEIRKAALRAAELTAQLLAFSRKQLLIPKVLNLNSILSETKDMLSRLLGEAIELRFNLEPEPWLVKIDPGQIHQVIMNLAINARDALPTGGIFTVITKNEEIHEKQIMIRDELLPGQYVRVGFKDSGTGMDNETMNKIFEPFFTTKTEKHGTGLGLATVHGIIKQSNGVITVHSEPGMGTTFEIYLPRTGEKEEASPEKVLKGENTAVKDSTILLVEDEEAIRISLAKILKTRGFKVKTADSPEAAEKIIDSYQGVIDLLISDIVMSGGKSGFQLVNSIRSRKKNLKTIFITGYTDEIISSYGKLNEGVQIMQKPFEIDSLLAMIDSVLTSNSGS
ncbi:MAG: response regulator [Spirochaetales bacterium]|nr:response regulator [Spirochaetales bacterium]